MVVLALWIFLVVKFTYIHDVSASFFQSILSVNRVSKLSDLLQVDTVAITFSFVLLVPFIVIALLRTFVFFFSRIKNKKIKKTIAVISITCVLSFVLLCAYQVLKKTGNESDETQNFSQEKIFKEIKNQDVARTIRKWVEKNCTTPGGGIGSPQEIYPDIQSVEAFTYGGEAEGRPVNQIKVFTFNIKTGKIYELSDLFKPNVNWAHLVWPYVENQIKECELAKPPKTEWDSRYYESFGINETNLTLYRDRCSWGPGACGVLTVNIPLEDIKDFLNPPFKVDQ
jgi:hypothetical protein